MYIPAARERVELIGRAGVFFVLGVDAAKQFATVVPLTGTSVYVEDVPFAQLRPQRPDVAGETGGATGAVRDNGDGAGAFL